MDTQSIYDVSATLANIDADVPRILALGALSLLCNFFYFGSAAYFGFKYKTYTMPLIGTLVFIPHDLHYLLLFNDWFNVYDHWFLQLFFAGLVVTNVLEAVFFYQVLRWGRRELMPEVSQKTYVTLLLVALAGVSVVWMAVKSVLADPLFFFSFGWTIWFCLPFVIPLMRRRGSAIGQSVPMWVAFSVMALCWWAAVWPLDPFFRSPVWIGLGIVTIVWAIANITMVQKFSASPVAAAAASQ